MHIFSLLSGSITSGAGGNALLKGKIASLEESGGLTEEMLQNPEKLFEALLSKGLVAEGELRKEVFSETPLSETSAKQASELSGEKSRKETGNSEGEFEEASWLLSGEPREIPFEMAQPEVSRCLAFGEPRNSSIPLSSQQKEAGLLGFNEKTEAELIALLSALDRKPFLSGGEIPLPEDFSETGDLRNPEDAGQTGDFSLPGLFLKDAQEASEKSGAAPKQVLKSFEGIAGKELFPSENLVPREDKILSEKEITNARENVAVPWGKPEGLPEERMMLHGETSERFMSLAEELGKELSPEEMRKDPEEGRGILLESLSPEEVAERTGETFYEDMKTVRNHALSSSVEQAEDPHVFGKFLENAVSAEPVSERLGSLHRKGEGELLSSAALFRDAERTTLPDQAGSKGSGEKSFGNSEKFLFSPELQLSEEEITLSEALPETDSFEEQLQASSRIGFEGMPGNSDGSSRVSEMEPKGLSTVPLPQSGLSSLGEGVAATLRIVRTSEGNRAQIIVDPPALGRVEVSLQSTDQGMSAVLRVDNEGLRQLLQGQMELLRSSLQQQGITVTNLSVDVRQGGDQASSGRGDQNSGSRRRQVHSLSGTYDLEGEEVLPTYYLDMEQGLLSWMA